MSIPVKTNVYVSDDEAYSSRAAVQGINDPKGNSIPQIAPAQVKEIYDMGKVKKFAALNIRKIIGGRDPVRVVEEFILHLNADPDKAGREKSSEMCRWMVQLSEGIELEIVLENIKKIQETTVYLGINLLPVPIRGAADILAAALEIADGLVGIKVSLVGHYLVLSSTLGAADLGAEDLDYHYRLIIAQRRWFLDSLSDELGMNDEDEA